MAVRVVTKFPEVCAGVQLLWLGGGGGACAVGLGARTQRLYANEHIVSDGVSSFSVHWEAQLLLYTTLGASPQLVAAPFSALLARAAAGGGGAAAAAVEPTRTRAIERGSRIVAVVQNDVTVVLQVHACAAACGLVCRTIWKRGALAFPHGGVQTSTVRPDRTSKEVCARSRAGCCSSGRKVNARAREPLAICLQNPLALAMGRVQ